MRSLISIFVFFAFTITIKAESFSYQDSLHLELKKKHTDSLRCELLISLSDYYHAKQQKDSSIAYALKAYEFAQKYVPNKITYCLMNISAKYINKQLYSEAMLYAKLSLQHQIEQKDSSYLEKSMNNIAWIYKEQGSYDSALTYFFQAMKIAEIKEEQKSISVLNDNIGHIYRRLKQNKKALDFYLKGLKISKKIGDKKLIARGLHNSAIIYRRLGNYDQALRNYQEALNVSQSQNNRMAEAETIVNIGVIYYYKGELTKAQNYIRKAKIIYEELESKKGMISVYNHMSKIYSATKQYKNAINSAKKSLRINEEMGLLEPKRDSYEYLHKDYATQKRFDSAYYYYQKYDEVNDSLEGIEKTKNINTLTFKYETEKKDQEIILLNKETELKSASFKIYLFVYGGILILLAGLVTFWYRVKKNKYENELNELRALKAEVDQENTKNITSFPVTVGKKIMLIDLDQITFFNAKDNYVFINTLKGKNFIIDYTLAALESHLPSQFVRVHRSYFINKNEIKAIKKTYKGKVIFTIKDSAASQIPSSIKYNNKVKDIIEQYGNLDS